MKNNLDLIKGLIVRVNMQTYSGDKKSAAKIIRNLNIGVQGVQTR